MDQNSNVENSGRFLNTMSLAMFKVKYGVTKVQKGTVTRKSDGKPMTIFVCVNSRGQEVLRGLVSASMASEGIISKNAQISEMEYLRDGETKTNYMMHHSGNQVELSDFEEE